MTGSRASPRKLPRKVPRKLPRCLSPGPLRASALRTTFGRGICARCRADCRGVCPQALYRRIQPFGPYLSRSAAGSVTSASRLYAKYSHCRQDYRHYRQDCRRRNCRGWRHRALSQKLRLTLDPFTPSILHLLPSYNRFCFRLITFDDIDAIFMSYV